MKYLSGSEKEKCLKFIRETVKIAKDSTCGRNKCGSIIVKNENIIGRRFNSPPRNLESQKRCEKDKKQLCEKVTNKMCCVHAD